MHELYLNTGHTHARV